MGQSVCLCTLLLIVSLCVINMHPLEAANNDDTDYLNSFIVRLHDNTEIKGFAEEHGFTIKEELPELSIFHLVHPQVASRSKRADSNYVSRAKEDPRVKLVEQQRLLKRVKRNHEIVHDKQRDFPLPDIRDNSKYNRAKSPLRKQARFNDKYYRDQWYLEYDNQANAKRGIDLNVVQAWEMGYTGKGTVVCILDDGLDTGHLDLKRNYDPKASDDLNDEDDLQNDPTPEMDGNNSHGTRCAGEVAAEAGNGICGVGVAYDCKIGGLRILDGPVTDLLEAKALLFQSDYIDIKSSSWGPHDNGQTMEGPSTLCKEAMQEAVKTGRKGKGTVFIWATGNGGTYGDNCGADGYVSGIESISVQSLSSKGELPFFGEICPSTMVAIPAGGEVNETEELKAVYDPKVVTTDAGGGCVENFEGTSSAAPLAAGCLALVLQANNKLTWRDVQHIVANGARIPGQDNMWIINGAGFHVNPQYGFGMMDCARMVELALGWVNKPPQHQCETKANSVNVHVASSGCHKLRFDFDGCQGDNAKSVTHMEHVEVTIKLKPVRRGNMQIFITSPSGTRSEVLRPRKKDDTDEQIDFTFMTVHNWGEDPAGEWTLEVCDQPPNGFEQSKQKSAAYFESWQLKVSGYRDDASKKRGTAKPMSNSRIETVAKEELERSRSIVLKRAQPNNLKHTDLTDREENVDEFVSSVDSVFQSFLDTFGERSLEEYLENYIAHKSGINNVVDDMNGKSYADDKREFEYGKEVDGAHSLKHEMVDILRDLDRRKTETGESFLDKYISRKREMLREERIRELIDQMNDLLSE